MRNQGSRGGPTKSLGKKLPLKGEKKSIPSVNPSYTAPGKLHD